MRVGYARVSTKEQSVAMEVDALRADVIWKLDRLGCSLKHLVTLTNELLTRQVGLVSLNDPVDTTTPQGRLVFNIFASLAEFERDLIRERTQSGLKAARTRGRVGGRPKGWRWRRKPSTGKGRSACSRSASNWASASLRSMRISSIEGCS